MPDTALATAGIKKAVQQANLAYQFGANSYSYAVLSLCLSVEIALTSPDWIGEFLAHAEAA